MSVLLRAEGVFDASERSAAEFGAPGASQESGGCKHQSSSHPAGDRAPVIVQSRQRRSLAQHGPSGLRAVAGAASATSAAASSRGSERRVDVKAALGQDAKCRPLRPHARDARWNKRD